MFDDVQVKGWWPNTSTSDCALDQLPYQHKDIPANANPFSFNISCDQKYTSLIGNGNGSIIRHQHFYISGRPNIYLV